MATKEELFPLFKKAIEQAAARTPPKAAINKDETIAAIVRRWFERQKRSPEEVVKTRTRIMEMTSKNEKSQEIGREAIRGELFLTKQPEFSPHLTNVVMEKVLDKVPQPLPAWMPSRAELNSNPYLAEAASRIALLPDPEDPAALYEQLTIMYRSANFSKMSDGEIREFRGFAEKTKAEIIRLAVDPSKKFKASVDDDMEFPWSKKTDVYRSRRLRELEANPTNDATILARNTRRRNFDVFLKDAQEQLELEDPRKVGKGLKELRGLIENSSVPDNSAATTKRRGQSTQNVFNESEANDYIGVIKRRIDSLRAEERWTPIIDEVAPVGPPGTSPDINRAKLLAGFEVDPAIVEKLTPEVRAYYEKVKKFLRVAPSEDINGVTIDGFLQQMEMLSRNKDPIQGRSPESDAALVKFIGVIQDRLSKGELEIPTSIYLTHKEVRDIMNDFPGWAERYMRKIELLIQERGTDDPALRPAMDRFNLAQEFYGGESFENNLITAGLPPDEVHRYEALFKKTYKDRVGVMDQYRVRLTHAELENQLEFVRDWDPKSQDVARVVELAKRLGDQGIFAMRGYHGGMVDVVASNYLLPIMSEKVFPSATRKRVRWTKELLEEVRSLTKERFKQDLPLYNEQYKKHMMDVRWRAKGTIYIEADQFVENQVQAGGVILTPAQLETMKRIKFEELINEKIRLKQIKYSSLDDEDSNETIDSIVRNAISSARLQFQVEEKVALSQRARFADMETKYSAFVFAGWEERFMKANYYYTDNKYRWGIEPIQAAMWRQGNEFIMTMNPEVTTHARRESRDEWNSFNNWWEQFHGTLPSGAGWEQAELQLEAFHKPTATPVQRELYDRYVHFVQQFMGYPRLDEIGTPIGPDKKDTYEFFRELKKDKLIGQRKFRRQIESSLVTTWQEDYLARSYLYWKSGERTKGYRTELRKVMERRGWTGDDADVDKYYFRGQKLFDRARERFFPDQKIETEKTRKELFEEIRDTQAGFHPLQFIQLEQRVEGVAGFDPDEFSEAEQRFNMIQGRIISRTLEDPHYKPINYLSLTPEQQVMVSEVFNTVHGGALHMTEARYLEYMRLQALHVQQNANRYTDLKYAELLGREILYYDDQPQAIIDPEQTVTASKGASNLYSRSLYDHILGLKAADMHDSLLTLDTEQIEKGPEELRIFIQGYQGAQAGAVAKALVLARYIGYTRGHVDLADGILRNNWLVSEAQEIGKYPGAPSNSAIELEHLLGKAQSKGRIEDVSPAFGETLDSFAGLSNWKKITLGENGPVAKIIGERRYHRVIRYLNDRAPSKVMLVRFGNLALYFSIFTLGLFIVQQIESGGEDKKK